MSNDGDKGVDVGIGYSRQKKSVVLDNKVFKVGDVKMIENGIFSKSYTFVQFDGKKWHVLTLDKECKDVKNFTFE